MATRRLQRNTVAHYPREVARYFLARAVEDGDLVTNLKMQKLVYYAYCWTLVKTGTQLFNEPMEAWSNGPVVPSLYHELKTFGSGPINALFLGGTEDSPIEDDIEQVIEQFNEEELAILEGVYQEYIRRSAFELVVLTHNELPWREARGDCKPAERCSNQLRDDLILQEFSNRE